MMRALLRALLLAAAGARRVAVVTGASRGIGRGIALQLGKEGYETYVLGRSSRESGMTNERAVAAGLDLTVESAAEAISAAGGIGHAISCDVGRDDEVAKAIATVTEVTGRLDLLVCSAYQTPPGKLRDDVTLHVLRLRHQPPNGPVCVRMCLLRSSGSRESRCGTHATASVYEAPTRRVSTRCRR